MSSLSIDFLQSNVVHTRENTLLNGMKDFQYIVNSFTATGGTITTSEEDP